MRDMGASHITAIIGPAICGSCYEVAEDVFSEVVENHPFARSKTAQGTLALDLPAALRSVLSDQGVAIINKFECTVESPELFSYRRDGVTGRQAGIISL
jgi:copper oxidase (laccase) domain-containing protein